MGDRIQPEDYTEEFNAWWRFWNYVLSEEPRKEEE